ncbi:MAG: hypothetical protein AAGC54_09370, partial [Cyanobacteria bacterium P01_F01_bin.4]
MMPVNQTIGLMGLFSILLAAATPCLAQTSPSDDSQANVTPAAQSTIAQRRSSKDKADRINYFGIGGTIGLSDDGGTDLGDGGFSLVGRFSVTDNISIHSASVISGDSVASFALTGGAPIRNQATGRTLLFPFLGAGVAIETDDFDVDPLVSGGVDVPITDLITGTARVNASFGGDGTDVGLVLGVGIDVL